jgi:hypothetical protein
MYSLSFLFYGNSACLEQCIHKFQDSIDNEIYSYVCHRWQMPHQSSPLPSLCNGSNVSARAGSTSGTYFLGSHAWQSVTVSEFQEHLGNMALIDANTFSKRKRNHNVSNQVTMEGGRLWQWFYWPRLAELTKKCLLVHCHVESTSLGSTIVLELLPDKFLINNVLENKKYCQHALDVWCELPCFLWTWPGQSFLMWWLWGCNSKPCICLLCIWCSFSNSGAKCNANALFLQINR